MRHDKRVRRATLHGGPPDVGLKACQLGCHHRLADGRSVDEPQLVVDELGHVAVAVLAHAARHANGVQHRLHVCHRRIGAAHEQDHVAADGRVHRSGDGCVNGVTARSDHLRTEFAHEEGLACGHVNPDLAGHAAGDQAALTADHLGDLRRPKDHGEDHVSLGGDLRRAVRPHRAVLLKRGARLAPDVVNHQVKPGPLEVAGGRAAHIPQADKAHRAHAIS